MPDLGSALVRIRQLLEDSGGFTAFDNENITRAVEDAVRKVGNKVGRNQGRLTISMVEDQQEYILPEGVRRINKVEIVPENG